MAHTQDVVVASLLRPDEAQMLAELLQSAGITATVYNAGLDAVYEPWSPARDAAKGAVFALDAERAAEIIRSSGIVPGPGLKEPIEIPEEEWSKKRMKSRSGSGQQRWSQPTARKSSPGTRRQGAANKPRSCPCGQGGAGRDCRERGR
jgi:hypothetical protein